MTGNKFNAGDSVQYTIEVSYGSLTSKGIVMDDVPAESLEDVRVMDEWTLAISVIPQLNINMTTDEKTKLVPEYVSPRRMARWGR